MAPEGVGPEGRRRDGPQNGAPGIQLHLYSRPIVVPCDSIWPAGGGGSETVPMSGAKTSYATERPPDRRKLVAVVYADMVGYSRLIGLDDVGTLERLRTLRTTLIDPAIAEHGGRIVQTGGDFSADRV